MYKYLLLSVAFTISVAAAAAPPAVVDTGDAAGPELLQPATPADLGCSQTEAVTEDPLALGLGLTFASDYCHVCASHFECESYCGGRAGVDVACVYPPGVYSYRCCACLNW